MHIEPKISVIVPVYNQEKYIGRCLRSLLDQSLTRTSYEIIVVNDGSTDKTVYALELFKEEIRVLHNKKNKGLAFSVNHGILNARGRFVIRVDSDDYVNNEFLNILLLLLAENPSMDAICCDYLLVNDDEKINVRKNGIDDPIACGIMFRIEQIVELGLYDSSFLVHEETDLRHRFLQKYTMAHVPLPLYRYRKHRNNTTNDPKLMEMNFKKFKQKHKI